MLSKSKPKAKKSTPKHSAAAPLSVTQEWLFLAEEDFHSAKVLYKANILGTAIYHAQQCAEKAFKGFLASKKQAIKKTHDLIDLVDDCEKFDKDFKKIRQAAKLLKPYATRTRYPDEYDIPEKSDVKVAINHAKKILDLTLKKSSVKEYQEII